MAQHECPSIAQLDPIEDMTPAVIGGKFNNLVQLRSMGVNVPVAVALTSDVYHQFVAAQNTGLLEAIKENRAATPPAELIAEAKLPSRIRGQIVEAHYQLSRRLNVREPLVAVRSSATCEDQATASFAGQFYTQLNCRGETEVIEAVRRVWMSALESRPREYARARGLEPDDIGMAVILQQQITAHVSGTAFSVDIETGANAILIQSTYGLGTSVVDGSTTPDTFSLDPKNLTPIWRRLGSKTKKAVYDESRRLSVCADTTVRERRQYSLRPDVLSELGKRVRHIHAFCSTNLGWQHVDVEYAIDRSDRIWITQVRPETSWSRRKSDGPLVVNVEKASGPEILGGGSTGYPGVVTARIRVVHSVSEAEDRLCPGDLLVCSATTNVWERALSIAGGAITDTGGTSCHTAIVLRELEKPCLVGTHCATKRLAPYDNRLVTVDATRGRVFLGRVPADCLTVCRSDAGLVQGHVDCETEEEAWRSIPQGRTGKTIVGVLGRRWMKRPGKRPVTGLMQSVYRKGYRWMSERMDLPVETRIRDGVHLVDFHGLWKWRLKLREMSLESLESLHEERLQAVRKLVATSENVQPNPASLGALLASFIVHHGFMAISFDFSKVADGLFRQELAAQRTPAAYLPRIERSMSGRFGETEAARALRDYKDLLDQARREPEIRDAPLAASEYNSLSGLPSSFAMNLHRYATRYKVTKELDFTLNLAVASASVAGTLLRDIERNRQISLPPRSAIEEEYFPGQTRFRRVARLCFEAARLREDAHHFRARSLFSFLQALEPVIQFLLRHGRVSEREQVFSHGCDWLIRRCQEYDLWNRSNRSAGRREFILHAPIHKAAHEDTKEKDVAAERKTHWGTNAEWPQEVRL